MKFPPTVRLHGSLTSASARPEPRRSSSVGSGMSRVSSDEAGFAEQLSRRVRPSRRPRRVASDRRRTSRLAAGAVAGVAAAASRDAGIEVRREAQNPRAPSESPRTRATSRNEPSVDRRNARPTDRRRLRPAAGIPADPAARRIDLEVPAAWRQSAARDYETVPISTRRTSSQLPIASETFPRTNRCLPRTTVSTNDTADATIPSWQPQKRQRPRRNRPRSHDPPDWDREQKRLHEMNVAAYFGETDRRRRSEDDEDERSTMTADAAAIPMTQPLRRCRCRHHGRRGNRRRGSRLAITSTNSKKTQPFEESKRRPTPPEIITSRTA